MSRRPWPDSVKKYVLEEVERFKKECPDRPLTEIYTRIAEELKSERPEVTWSHICTLYNKIRRNGYKSKKKRKDSLKNPDKVLQRLSQIGMSVHEVVNEVIALRELAEERGRRIKEFEAELAQYRQLQEGVTKMVLNLEGELYEAGANIDNGEEN